MAKLESHCDANELVWQIAREVFDELTLQLTDKLMVRMAEGLLPRAQNLAGTLAHITAGVLETV